MMIAFGINMGYALIAVIMTVLGMRISFRVLDDVTKFDTSIELKQGNVAVGLTVGGMLIGIGIAVGLVVGLAIN